MSVRGRAALSTGLSALVAACAPDPIRIPLAFEGEPPLIAIVALLDASGRLSRQFIETDGFEDKLELPLGGAERTALLVTMSRAQILAWQPDVDLERISEARIELGTDCETGRINEEGTVRSLPLPDQLDVFSAELSAGAAFEPATGSFAALAKLRLAVHVIPEWCRVDEEDDLRPYGGRVVLTEGLVVDGAPRSLTFAEDLIRYFNIIDLVLFQEQLIVATSGGVYLLDRGEPFVDGVARYAELYTRAGVPRGNVGVALNTLQTPARVAVLARDEEVSRVWELDVESDAGFSVVGGTDLSGKFNDVAYDEQGRLIVVGDDGRVMTGTDASSLIGHQIRAGLSLRRIELSDQPGLPHLIGSGESDVIAGDAFAQRWEVASVRNDLGNAFVGSFRVRSLTERATPQGREIWVAGDDGFILRSAPDSLDFSLYVPVPPFRLGGCVGSPGQCGARSIPSEINQIGFLRSPTSGLERLLTFPEDCPGALAIEIERGCAIALLTESIELGPRSQLLALAVGPDYAVVGGLFGALLETGR